MNCYFYQNIAYIAFKTEEQMHKICDLQIYTDDNTLLIGRPRLQSSGTSHTANSTEPNLKRKAMSTQVSSHKKQQHPRQILRQPDT